MRCFLSDVPRGTTLYCASKGRYGSRKMNASLDGFVSATVKTTNFAIAL